MSLYGVLRTGVSGMTSQSNKLGTVADNIANSGTAGYKRASTEFSSLLLESGSGVYNSGAVKTGIRHAISDQGALSYTTSPTDLAIQGNGFFVVSDANDTNYMTRAGSFVVDAQTGNLVNSAGFTLMGYDISNGKDPDVVVNGAGGLQPVHISTDKLAANPSTKGDFAVNLPFSGESGDVVPWEAPPDQKSSLKAFDNLGQEVLLDITWKSTGVQNEWTVDIVDRNTGTAYVNAEPVEFNSVGEMTTPATSTLNFTIDNGQPFDLNIGGTTQLATKYTPLAANVNGNAPSSFSDVKIDDDGVVSGVDQNGRESVLYKIPIATVISPDALNPRPGNVFETTNESGTLQIGFANEAGLGTVVSGATEQSNVDMADELTEMIVAQRDYTANSKVFQTGSELLELLMNLKR